MSRSSGVVVSPNTRSVGKSPLDTWFDAVHAGDQRRAVLAGDPHLVALLELLEVVEHAVLAAAVDVAR